MDLKIRTKSSVIGFMIFKYVLKSCVIDLMIHKFYIKSSVIQSHGFTNIFDFIIDLNGFVWILVKNTKTRGVSGSKIYIEYVDFKSWKIC